MYMKYVQVFFAASFCHAFRTDLRTAHLASNESRGPSPDPSKPLVAVLEHRTNWGDTALSTIKQNLRVYEIHAEKAAKKDVKLLVTPEYGVTGFVGSSRKEWSKSAVDIPEISEDIFVPCDVYGERAKLEKTPGLLALWRLSCIAKANELALVASLVDFKDCTKGSTHPDCAYSYDGWLLFNTNVVFDSDGRFVVKYHKTNLWGEHAMDVPHRCQDPSFTLKDFDVTFGMFTCADIIHSWPALHQVAKGVRHFVMPLAWSNEMTQMQPLAWLQSWSRINNVVLLAANARDPYEESGSGIFSGGKVIRHVYGITHQSGNSLLIAPLPQAPSTDNAALACPSPPRQGYPKQSTWTEKSQWETRWIDMSPGVHTVRSCSSRSKTTCCTLEYHATGEGQKGFGYVLGVLDGEDGSDGIIPWSAQACAVLPCTRGQDCMEYPTDSILHDLQKFPTFASLSLQAMVADEARVFPQILMGGDNRLVTPSALDFDVKANTLQYSVTTGRNLVMMQLYGRLHKEDYYGHHLSCGCGPSAESQRDMEQLKREMQRVYDMDDDWDEEDHHDAPFMPRSSFHDANYSDNEDFNESDIIMH